ncbi:hypothetical protein G9F32_00850 [Acinetobacter sp. 194]|uniref:hypothetical protein n=1 Tax=Acinetobacter shaoyimingii TaxID=2715164 RepID=UPI00140BA039|nr:hypothetical protein [Acinetobacter shaoyimingii]NHB56586.1 hypothetical protein [Acinetobacter shaoyimingii]
MLYVIPFIVLLVVLILLKLRDRSKKDTNKSKTTTSKKAAAKASKRNGPGSSNDQNNPPASDPDALTQSKGPSSIDEKFKQSIEKLIKARTFYTAEAKINQALNQDSSQHELYLYLVDIHLAQNDDFAIKQLLNYVRSLGLDDIAELAEEKQRNYVPEEIVEEPQPVQTLVEETPAESDHSAKGNKAFDALIIDNGKDSFDELHSSFNSEPEEKDDLKVFEFYTTPPASQKPVEQVVEPEPVEAQQDAHEDVFVNKIESFDFGDSKLVLNEPTEDTTTATQVEPLSFSNQSLDFNLSQPAQIEVEEPAINLENEFSFEEKTITEATPLDSDTSIDLDVDIPNVATESKDEQSNSLDFNLDTPEFNFKLEDSNTSVNTPENDIEPSASNELEFDALNDHVQAETVQTEPQNSALAFEPSMEFTLDSAAVSATTHETSTEQALVDDSNTAQDLEFSFETPSTTYTADTPNESASDVVSHIEPEALSIEPSALAFTSSTLSDVATTESISSETVSTDTTSVDPVSIEFETPVENSITELAAQSEVAATQAENINDPLALAFPHLNDVDETTLDLQLAERYIALGAFESAKQLLSRNTAQYTAEQRELSENLLNKIAS